MKATKVEAAKVSEPASQPASVCIELRWMCDCSVDEDYDGINSTELL